MLQLQPAVAATAEVRVLQLQPVAAATAEVRVLQLQQAAAVTAEVRVLQLELVAMDPASLFLRATPAHTRAQAMATLIMSAPW